MKSWASRQEDDSNDQNKNLFLASSETRNGNMKRRRRRKSNFNIFEKCTKFSVLFDKMSKSMNFLSDVPLNSLRTHIISLRYRIRVEFRRRESLPLAVKTSIIIYSNHYQQNIRALSAEGGWNNLQKTLRWFSRARQQQRKIYRSTSFKLVICNSFFRAERFFVLPRGVKLFLRTSNLSFNFYLKFI